MNTRRIIAASFFSLLFLASCGKATVVRKEATIGHETLEVMMLTGKKVTHPVHGEEVWFAVGPMSGEGQTKANGVAQSHVFADDASIATVLLNIQPPAKGYHYIPWFRKPGSADRVRLDALENPFKDVRHVITTEVKQDLRGYTEVVVTLERDAGASPSDPVQATGTVKEQHR